MAGARRRLKPATLLLALFGTVFAVLLWAALFNDASTNFANGNMAFPQAGRWSPNITYLFLTGLGLCLLIPEWVAARRALRRAQDKASDKP